MRIAMTGLAALALAGCNTTAPSQPIVAPAAAASSAAATLRLAAGTDAGTATAAGTSAGLTVTVAARGLTPGVHGAHLHTTGLCDPPGFTTAGGHWNPTGRMHGAENPMGPHEGDLPNITIGSDGTGTLTFTVAGATLAGLLDADGAALVIHAGPDDYRTDPAGNSGGRIACGVFARS